MRPRSRPFEVSYRYTVPSAQLEQRPDLLAEGPDAALWAIMDKIVDDYAPVVQCLDTDISELEATVFTGSVAPSERIF